MDNVFKSFQNNLTLPDEERDKLDAYLRNQGKVPEVKKNPFKAHQLKAQQDSSETVLGKLFGIDPITEEERKIYLENRDPNFEQGMDMALQLGMGMGGLNNITPKALSALKGGAFTGAQKTLAPIAEEANNMADRAKELLPKATEKFSSTFTPKHAADLETLEAIKQPTQQIMNKIVNLRNRKYKVFK